MRRRRLLAATPGGEMGHLDEFPLALRLFLRAYPWRRIRPVPWSPLPRPLAAVRLALVSSAGMILPGQPAFDERVKGGDPTLRWIPSATLAADLLDTHRSESFDHSGLRSDPNLAFPLDRARELVAAGRVGSLAPFHVSLMGSITAPGRLVRETAPTIAERLVGDGVEAAILVPV